MDLERRLQKNSTKPAILNVNIGTTVRGAVDDLDKVLAALERTGYSEDRFFIHCDGALFGLMVRSFHDYFEGALRSYYFPNFENFD